MEEEENPVEETDTQCLRSSGKPVRGTDHAVQKQPTCEIDLRIEGVPQDAIFEDDEQMKRDQRKTGDVEKWIMFKIHLRRLELKDQNLTFSEESCRVIYEMGNMKLFELREVQRLFDVFLA